MYFDIGIDLHLYVEFLKEKKNLKESSMNTYKDIVESFIVRYKDVTKLENYNDFLIKHAIKKRSMAAYSALKSFAQYKIKDKAEQTLLIDGMIKPPLRTTSKRERQYLTEEQIIDLINNLENEKHKIVALIQDLTGVRAGDVLRIKRGNIHPEIYDEKAVLKIIIEGKGDKLNVIYIHDEIVQSLILHYVIHNFVSQEYYFLEDKTRTRQKTFANYMNYRANYIAYYRDMKQAMYKTGVSYKDFATHDYRRCYARRVWTRYKDIHVLQELLNHVNPATTMKYLKQSGMQNVDYHKEMQTK